MKNTGLELKVIINKINSNQLEEIHKLVDGKSIFISGIKDCTNVLRVDSKQGPSNPVKEEIFGQAYLGVEVTVRNFVKEENYKGLSDRLYNILKSYEVNTI